MLIRVEYLPRHFNNFDSLNMKHVLILKKKNHLIIYWFITNKLFKLIKDINKILLANIHDFIEKNIPILKEETINM